MMPRAIEKFKRANSYYESGIIYLRGKKYGKAIKAFEEAIDIDSNNIATKIILEVIKQLKPQRMKAQQ